MQIKTKNISYTYDLKTQHPFNALVNVSSTIEQGDFIGIIGETGSGKTTYIQHLNALLLPQKGEVLIGEMIIRKTKKRIKKIKQIRSKVGVVFQFPEYQLFADTIEKDVIFGPVNMGVNPKLAKEEAKGFLKMVGINPDKYLQKSPFELSGGQKRRVAIAGILSMKPDVLIFDEPTAGLDPKGKKEVLKILNKLNKEGKTIIMVTHDLDDVLKYAKKTFLFKQGQLIKTGKTFDILNDLEFLKENNLKLPLILEFNEKLKAKGIELGKVTCIKDLAKKIILYKKERNNE